MSILTSRKALLKLLRAGYDPRYICRGGALTRPYYFGERIMCGIVGAVAQRDVAPILLEGLKRLEYRGYDSAGIAVMSQDGKLVRERA
ncbi:MAG: hypothetical protein SFW07_05275, partial [Gammaproteobacteria bacterium]|nr:hypothetical protein [Gammaproteobacteria bacterium]